MCTILGSCSGLVLFDSGRKFCVANPFTKRFLFLDPPDDPCLHIHYSLGFAVNRITQRFTIVLIRNLPKRRANESVYEFVISSGDSWRVLTRKITHCSSSLDTRGGKPVYLDGTLHFLLTNGNVIAFNVETEEARLIPAVFQGELRSTKQFLGAAENRLTLLSASEEVISFHTLENNLDWSLASRIKNVSLQGKNNWNVAAFEGKCLVVAEHITKHGGNNVVFHGYDMRADKWRVVGLCPKVFFQDQHLYHFTPSWSSVIGVAANPTELWKEELAKLGSIYNPKWTHSHRNLLDRFKIVTALSSFFKVYNP